MFLRICQSSVLPQNNLVGVKNVIYYRRTYLSCKKKYWIQTALLKAQPLRPIHLFVFPNNLV